MTINQNYCAFTGHRPNSFPWKYNEADRDCVLLKEVLTVQIAALADRGVSDWFSGMAQGLDVWAAEIVLSLREKNPALTLQCVLPHKGQADRWSDSARERYHAILEQAGSVTYVSREYYDGCLIDKNHRLDESTSQLDPIAASDFLAVLGRINRELGTTIILTEHSLEDAFPLASRVAVMDGGKCGVLTGHKLEKSGVGDLLHMGGYGSGL